MNIRILAFLFILFFVGNGTVLSQEAAIVTVTPFKPVVVEKGQTAQLLVRAIIKEGFHIQANPAADEFLIPVTLEIQSNAAGIVAGKPIYPPGRPYRLKGSSKDLLTYEGEVVIRLPVKVMGAAPTGASNLTGKLNFQPCDDRKCLFPRSVPVVIPVEIVRSQ